MIHIFYHLKIKIRLARKTRIAFTKYTLQIKLISIMGNIKKSVYLKFKNTFNFINS